MISVAFLTVQMALLLLLSQDVRDRSPDELGGLRSVDGLPDAGLAVVVDDGAGLL